MTLRAFTLDCVPLTHPQSPSIRHPFAALAELMPIGARVRVAAAPHRWGYWGVICEITPHDVRKLNVEPGQWWTQAQVWPNHLDAVDLSQPGPARAAACEWLQLSADADDETLTAALKARA